MGLRGLRDVPVEFDRMSRAISRRVQYGVYKRLSYLDHTVLPCARCHSTSTTRTEKYYSKLTYSQLLSTKK